MDPRSNGCEVTLIYTERAKHNGEGVSGTDEITV